MNPQQKQQLNFKVTQCFAGDNKTTVLMLDSSQVCECIEILRKHPEIGPIVADIEARAVKHYLRTGKCTPRKKFTWGFSPDEFPTHVMKFVFCAKCGIWEGQVQIPNVQGKSR